ncbi:MAG: PQQ-binding-like beta-propeller repeat protein [Candidatus Polarisedimenticolia bacterium]
MRRGSEALAFTGILLVAAACGSQQGGAGGPLPKGVTWAHHMGGAITSRPTVMGDKLLVASANGSLQMLSRKDGSVKWSYDARTDAPEAAFHHRPVLVDGLILNATEAKGSGHVYAFDASSGKVVWKHALGADPNSGAGGSVTDVIQRDGHVYAIGLDGMMVCLDLKSGNKIWEAGPVETRIAPAAGPTYVYAAVGMTHMHGLDPMTGATAWDADLNAVVTTGLLAHGEEVYAGTSPFRMFRIDGKTGAVLVKMALQGKPVYNPIISNGAVSVFLRDANGIGDTANTIISLDAGLSKILWGRKAAGEWTSRNPQIYEDVVLAGDNAGELFAYGQADGMKKWSFKMNQGLGAIGTSDEMLYVGTLEGLVYAFQPPGKGSAGL